MKFEAEKISLDISCELSAWHTIHMKCQNLFKKQNKTCFRMLSAAFVIGTLRAQSVISRERSGDNEKLYEMKYPSVLRWILPLAGFKPGTSDPKSEVLTAQSDEHFTVCKYSVSREGGSWSDCMYMQTKFNFGCINPTCTKSFRPSWKPLLFRWWWWWWFGV